MFVCLQGLFELTACAVSHTEEMPQSLFASTLTVAGCSPFSGSTARKNHRNVSTSVDSPCTLTFLSLYSLLSEWLNLAFSLFSLFTTSFSQLISPLLPLTSFPVSDSQSGGFRHRFWVGGSCGWGEILAVKKQRFRKEPLRWRQPQELQVSTKATAVTITSGVYLPSLTAWINGLCDLIQQK